MAIARRLIFVVLAAQYSGACWAIVPLDLARTPSAFLGEAVKLNAIACIEEVRDGYVCIAKSGGSLVAIDAVILGDETAADIYQYMHDQCLGTSNLDNSECYFDVSFRPTSFEINDKNVGRLTRFYARTLDVARPKSRQKRTKP